MKNTATIFVNADAGAGSVTSVPTSFRFAQLQVYDNPIQQLRPRRIGRLIKDNSFGTPFTCPLPTYPGCYSCLRAVALVLVVEVIYFCLSQRLAPQSSRCSNHPRGRHDSAVTGRPKSAL